jgi:signal transduction histidine kinase
MRERAAAIEGRLSWGDAPGGGGRVILDVPLHARLAATVS